MMTENSGKKSKEGGNINEVLCYEILVKILMMLNVGELGTVSMVCKAWKEACRDPRLWKKLDLTALCFSPLNIPKRLRAWEDTETSAKLNGFLKNTLRLSDSNVSCLVFNFYAILRDQHLISAAQRTPNLKRLILPCNGDISETAIDLAMSSWKGLQSITITNMVNPTFFLSAIGKHCIEITELKLFTCWFNERLAESVVKETPNLKFLSIQSMMVKFKALCYVLEHLVNLEAVNVCHSLIWDSTPEGGVVYMNHDIELRQHLPVEVANKVVFCVEERCVICKNKNHKGNEMTYGIVEELWRIDEIESLAH